MKSILGVDPGLLNTGWGIVTKEKGELHYVASGVISTKALAVKENNLILRLTYIFSSLKDILKSYSPIECAIENTYVNLNYGSSLKLAQARAAAIVACGESGITVIEYQAKTIKKALTGNGQADKVQVVKALKFYLKTMPQIKSTDESDALSIAACHAYHIKY